MNNTVTGFNRLDFEEALSMAAKVNFDIMIHAKKITCCGPGCDYFAKDKRFFITMLVKHVGELIERGDHLQGEIREWYEQAGAAVREYGEMEARHLRIRRGEKADR